MPLAICPATPRERSMTLAKSKVTSDTLMPNAAAFLIFW